MKVGILALREYYARQGVPPFLRQLLTARLHLQFSFRTESDKTGLSGLKLNLGLSLHGIWLPFPSA